MDERPDSHIPKLRQIASGIRSGAGTLILKVLTWITIIGGLVLFILAFQCALTPSSCNVESARWWGLLIGALGVPLVVWQVRRLPEEISRAQWRPVISVGLKQYPLLFRDVDWRTSLLRTIQIVRKSSNVFVTVVLQNKGDKVAGFVKIHLELSKMSEGTNQPNIQMIYQAGKEKFARHKTGRDFVFRGGPSWRIYPRDFEPFKMEIDPHDLDESKERHYWFNCTVWAEGLDPPYTQQLEIIVVDSS